MSEHTPGPWSAREKDPNEWCIDANERRLHAGPWTSMSVVYGCDDDENGPQIAKANASLIAAAPDLLEALERLVAGCDRLMVSQIDGLADARGAIAKARGQ